MIPFIFDTWWHKFTYHFNFTLQTCSHPFLPKSLVGSLVRNSIAFPGLAPRHTCCCLTIPFTRFLYEVWLVIVKHTNQSWSEEAPSINVFLSVFLQSSGITYASNQRSNQWHEPLKMTQNLEWTHLGVVLIVTGRNTLSVMCFSYTVLRMKYTLAIGYTFLTKETPLVFTPSTAVIASLPSYFSSTSYVANHSQENPGSWWLC